jgi:hypothetical protein
MRLTYTNGDELGGVSSDLIDLSCFFFSLEKPNVSNCEICHSNLDICTCNRKHTNISNSQINDGGQTQNSVEATALSDLPGMNSLFLLDLHIYVNGS